MFEIIFYQDKNGKSDIVEYLNKLNKSSDKDSRIKLKKINMYIELIEEFGFHLNEPYIKKLDDEIWELRPLNDRILFAYLNENKFILLTYFIKDTRKTPKNELDRARKILENYKRGYEK